MSSIAQPIEYWNDFRSLRTGFRRKIVGNALKKYKIKEMMSWLMLPVVFLTFQLPIVKPDFQPYVTRNIPQKTYEIPLEKRLKPIKPQNRYREDIGVLESLVKKNIIPEEYEPIFKRALSYQKTIERIEYLIGPLAEDYPSVVGAESDFNPNAISPKGAVGLAQVMPERAIDVFERMKFEQELLSRVFNLEAVERMYITPDLSKLHEEIDLEQLGYRPEEALKYREAYNISLAKITTVILPKYLLLKRILPGDSLDEERFRKDPEYNYTIGCAAYISDRIELGNLQITHNSNQEPIYVHRYHNFFNGKEHLRAFSNEAIKAAYNRSPSLMRGLGLELASQGIYNPMPYVSEETRTHSTRIKRYEKIFNILQKYGLFCFQNDELA